MAFDKNKYDNQYKKEHYWRPNVVFPIEMKETVLEVAKKHNLSVAKLSIQAIIREIERLEKESK